jgi:hypothetical protein
MNTRALMVYDTPWVQRPDEAEATGESDTPSPVSRPPLGNRDFFAGKSLSELAREQGVGPVKDISVFAGGFPEDEDLDELLAELERIRTS